jgi:hypothetical protein
LAANFHAVNKNRNDAETKARGNRPSIKLYEKRLAQARSGLMLVEATMRIFARGLLKQLAPVSVT